MKTYEVETEQGVSEQDEATAMNESGSKRHIGFEEKAWGWLVTFVVPALIVLGVAYLLFAVVVMVFFPDTELGEQLRIYASQPTCGPTCAA